MATVEEEDEFVGVLQQEINQLQQESAKLQAKYASVRSCESLPKDQERAAKCVMRRKLSLLKSEIEIRKQAEVRVLPENNALWYECLKQELTKSVTELKATAAHLKTEKKLLEAKIQNVQGSLDREAAFQSALRQKMEELRDIPDRLSESRHKAASIARRKKVRAHLDRLTHEMNQFFAVHFPPPTAREIAQRTQGLPSHWPRDGEVQSMAQIVQSLIGQWTDCRHAPHVATRGFWPPYLELLLRTGVAERHSHDPSLVRLQDLS